MGSMFDFFANFHVGFHPIIPCTPSYFGDGISTWPGSGAVSFDLQKSIVPLHLASLRPFE